MAVTFPATKRYFVTFRNSDVGLTPTWIYYSRADTLVSLLPGPSFTELSNGTYYFDITFSSATSPDIIFCIDGGLSIPTEEIRFQTSMASPKDLFLDQPSSQAVTDVWNNTTTYGAGTKGAKVDSIAAAPTSAIAAAVWDELLAGHSIAGSAGKKLFDGALTSDVTAAQSALSASLGAQLTRALGLMHENSVLDQTIFDGQNNMTNGRLRIYSSKANALLAGATGLLETYTITASYIGDNVQNYTVVREGS